MNIITRLVTDAIIRTLQAIGKIRSKKDEYPAGLKIERKEEFKKRIEEFKKKGDK